MRRYQQTRHGWMEPDDEHGGWVQLTDALAAIEQARAEERDDVARLFDDLHPDWAAVIRGLADIEVVVEAGQNKLAAGTYETEGLHLSVNITNPGYVELVAVLDRVCEYFGPYVEAPQQVDALDYVSRNIWRREIKKRG